MCKRCGDFRYIRRTYEVLIEGHEWQTITDDLPCPDCCVCPFCGGLLDTSPAFGGCGCDSINDARDEFLTYLAEGNSGTDHPE